MKKMISLFERDWSNKECPAYDQVCEGAEWVANGEGIATRKFDGTACMILYGRLYRRLHAKKHSPDAFIHWSLDPEQRTGHGWIPVTDSSNDHMHNTMDIEGLEDGTYELCGEKINKNPEHIHGLSLIKHGSATFPDAPRDFKRLKVWFADKDIEGIVWHHPNGDMIKMKKSDFRMVRSVK